MHATNYGWVGEGVGFAGKPLLTGFAKMIDSNLISFSLEALDRSRVAIKKRKGDAVVCLLLVFFSICLGAGVPISVLFLFCKENE